MCSTPSVPLPPPAVDTSALSFTEPAAGSVILSGLARQVHADARFYILDRQSGDGVITTAAADGSFTAPPLSATIGDVAEVYFDTPDGKASEHVCVTVLLQQTLIGASCP